MRKTLVMRNRFKKALQTLLQGEFSRNRQTMWEAWRDNLHDIDPEGIPPSVREKFIWCRDAIMNEFNHSVKADTGKGRDGAFNTPELAREHLWNGGESWQFCVNQPLQGMGHQRIKKIKLLLFEVFCELPFYLSVMEIG